MTWLITFLKALFTRPQAQPVEDVVTPVPTPVLPIAPIVEVPTPSELLAKIALNCLGLDVTPKDDVPDEVACAEVVSTILRKTGVNIPVIPSTATLYLTLKIHPRFKRVQYPEAGVVIISPTGYGNGTLAHGHTGIFINDWDIASNNSDTGKFEENYTKISWYNRYGKIAGFPLIYFKLI